MEADELTIIVGNDYMFGRCIRDKKGCFAKHRWISDDEKIYMDCLRCKAHVKIPSLSNLARENVTENNLLYIMRILNKAHTISPEFS